MLVLGQSGAPHKLDNCCSSLQRYDAIADLAQLVSAGFVHQTGQPISQHANAGFNRRGKVRPVGDNGRPSRVERTGREKASARQSSMSIRLLPSGRTVASPPPFQIRAVGVGHCAAALGSIRSPSLPAQLVTVGVIHCLAASAIVGLSAAPADAERLMRSCPVSGVGHAPCKAEQPEKRGERRVNGLVKLAVSATNPRPLSGGLPSLGKKR